MKKLNIFILSALLSATIIVFGSSEIRAQNDCDEALKRANELFQNGEFDAVILLLEDKLKTCDYSKEEFTEVCKIISSAYYETDQIENGNNTIREMLKNNPNYKANPNFDPPIFTKSYYNFRVHPKLSVGFKLGINRSYVNVKKIFPVLDSADYSQPYKSDDPPCFDVYLRWHLTEYLSLSTGFGFQSQSFSKHITASNNVTMDYWESYRAYKLPVSVNYSPVRLSGFIPSIYVGVYKSLGGTAEYNLGLRFPSQNDQFMTFDESDNITSSFRNLNNWGFGFGTNLAYRKNSLEFFADVSYNSQLGNYSTQTQFPKNDFPHSYHLVSDEIQLNNLEICLGVSFSILYAVKLKH